MAGDRRRNVLLFAALAFASIGAKVALAGLGHNFDIESWALFADLVREGKNVYAETYRNPYGPLWAHLCAAISFIQTEGLGSTSIEGFHRLVAFFLALVDVAIAVLLFRRYSFIAGLLFVVNPVSLLVTGFHSQFGNLAVLFALAGCLLLDSPAKKPLFAGLGLGLLGVSLVTKHLLVFLPLWFFLKPGASRLERLAALSPLALFGLSFLPYVADEPGLEGVIEHVFLYDSFHLDGFFPRLVSLLVPLSAIERLFAWVPVFSGFKFVWMVAMLVTGFAVRGKDRSEQLLVYLAAVLVFSSAIADQYLAIPLVTCAVYWRRVSLGVYVALSALYLSASTANVGMLESMASWSETVRATGLDRWHPVTALFLFLLLYLFDRRARRHEEGAPSRGR